MLGALHFVAPKNNQTDCLYGGKKAKQCWPRDIVKPPASKKWWGGIALPSRGITSMTTKPNQRIHPGISSTCNPIRIEQLRVFARAHKQE